eukprot:scaffold5516_cov112-Isochrysis_galbana.AAC.1
MLPESATQVRPRPRTPSPHLSHSRRPCVQACTAWCSPSQPAKSAPPLAATLTRPSSACPTRPW